MAKIQQSYGKNITKFKVTIIMVKNDKIQYKYSKNLVKVWLIYKFIANIQQKSDKNMADLWPKYGLILI